MPTESPANFAQLASDATDARLVSLALSHSHLARHALVQRYTPLVKWLLARFPERDDLAQEVFCRFFVTLPSLRNQASARAYIHGIALRVAREAARRARRELRLFDRMGVDFDATADGTPAPAPLSALLTRIASAFGPEAARLFELRYSWGLSVPLVARKLRMSASTVKRRLKTYEKCARVLPSLQLLNGNSRGGDDQFFTRDFEQQCEGK